MLGCTFSRSGTPFLTQPHILHIFLLRFLFRILTVNLDKDGKHQPCHSPMLGCL